MAVVQKLTASSGITIVVHDDLVCDLSAEQRSARWAEFYASCRRVIYDRIANQKEESYDATNRVHGGDRPRRGCE